MHSHLKIVRLPLLRVGRGEAPLPGRSCDFGRAWTFMPLPNLTATTSGAYFSSASSVR